MEQPVPPKRTKITWSKDERKAIADEITRLVSHDHTITPIRAINAAELSVLPPERRRLKTQMAFYTSAKDDIMAAYQRGLQGPPSVSVSEPPPEPSPEPIEEETYEPPVDSMALIAQIAIEVGKNLIERLDRIESALIARIGPPPGWRPPEVKRVKPVVKRIGIVGLFKDQFEHVRQKVAHLPYTFIWIDKDDRHYTIPPNLAVMIIQRHTDHAWFNNSRGANIESHFVDGGITGVVQKIFDIHSRRRNVVA